MSGLAASTHRRRGNVTEQVSNGETADEDRSHHETESTEGLSKDQAFDILRNSRRRAIISGLRARGGELSVKELSTYVAAEEYGVPASELTPEQYKRVYTGLYQCHLDRMEELGVIDFDTDTNTVTLHHVASHLEPYLDSETRLASGRLELAVAVMVTSITAIGITGISPLGTIPPASLAVLTIVALLGLALLQIVD